MLDRGLDEADFLAPGSRELAGWGIGRGVLFGREVGMCTAITLAGCLQGGEKGNHLAGDLTRGGTFWNGCWRGTFVRLGKVCVGTGNGTVKTRR